MMNTRPPPPPPPNHQSPFFPSKATVSPPPPPPHFFPHQYEPPSLHSWHDHDQDFQDSSFSQLLMSGLVGDREDHKPALTQMQKVKKLEIWEEQLLQDDDNHHLHRKQNPPANGDSMEESLVKQEASPYGYGYGDDKDEFRGIKPTNWSDQMIQSSCPNSCVTSLSGDMVDLSTFSSNKADGRHPPPDRSSESNSNGASGDAAKKAKVQPSSQSTFKVRKEKLGDRITALHHIVSPFGKTDTASVLSEAMGYIRFLQAQIQALSLPYLGTGSANMKHNQHSDYDEEPDKNLRSRGLCLVPLSCTMQVGSDNAADYWAPANNLRL